MSQGTFPAALLRGSSFYDIKKECLLAKHKNFCEYMEDNFYDGIFSQLKGYVARNKDEIESSVFILDTKYKMVSSFEGNTEKIKRAVSEKPKQTDIYQVCKYARKRGISDLYLLYPMFRAEQEEPYLHVGRSLGEFGNINIYFVRLPFVSKMMKIG